MQQVTFYDLGLSKQVLQGIEMMGYVLPSPIQEKAIPVLLDRLRLELERLWLLEVFYCLALTKRMME